MGGNLSIHRFLRGRLRLRWARVSYRCDSVVPLEPFQSLLRANHLFTIEDGDIVVVKSLLRGVTWPEGRAGHVGLAALRVASLLSSQGTTVLLPHPLETGYQRIRNKAQRQSSPLLEE